MNNQKAGRFARPAFGVDMEEEDAMVLKKTAVAGTLESSDVMVTVTPNPGRGVEIELESEVKAAFGAAIEAVARRELELAGVEDAHLLLRDKGALDCVISARVRCALYRAAEAAYDWTREDAL